MTEYVVGFAFDHLQRVILIRKKRPDWQKDHLNGVGGHVEPGETYHEAMSREFREETGVDVRNWHCFALMTGPDWKVGCFRAEGVSGVKTMTDELIECCDPFILPRDVLPNLFWLVPMAFQNHAYAEVKHD